MIYDISPLISSKTAVFPGDVEFQRKVSMDFSQGDHISLSAIVSTLHLGAHADAPSHYHSQGKSIDQCDLHIYLGRCQVVDVSSFRGELQPSVLEGLEIQAPRVLFKTNSIVSTDHWQNDFTFLSPALVKKLSEQNVKLIGIDTPSMDHAQSKTLDGHQAFYQQGISILEGLVLENVPAGIYYLIALPLKIKDGEASPVRAILMDQNNLDNF